MAATAPRCVAVQHIAPVLWGTRSGYSGPWRHAGRVGRADGERGRDGVAGAEGGEQEPHELPALGLVGGGGG